MTASPRSLPLVALVLAVAVLVIKAPLVAGGQTWADREYHTEVAPPRLAAAEAIQHGELPAWWEGSGLGVPLAAEPSHGALYPPTWIGATPRALDLVSIAHLVWAALGIAMWTRRRRELGASEPASVVVALLAISSGLFASLAIRGALPAIAQLPWIGLCAAWLREAEDRRTQGRATIGLALVLGLTGLTGVLPALVDGVVIAIAVGGQRRRPVAGYLAAAIAAGLAISAIQWLPAILQLGRGAGAAVHAIPFARLIELIVPGSFGASDPARGVSAMAGDHAWAPSLFVGAALLGLAAVRTPSRRVLAAIGAFVALALVVGRGGWPAWLGAPELHLAALVVVLAVHAGSGLDDLLAGKRRALVTLAVGAACTLVALAALGALRGRHPDAAPAIDRALLDGGLGLVCLAGALALAWRGPRRSLPLVLALVVLPSVGAVPATAPTIDRSIVEEPPALVAAALAPPDAAAPRRVFRPVYMAQTRELAAAQSTAEAIATLTGASASSWGLAAARSEDPARLRIHDRTWLAAAREGGALLDRFGIALAILPATLIVPRKLDALATRGSWTLVRLPVAPPAAVLRGVLWSADPANALELMYPAAGGTGVLPGTVVLAGRGSPADDHGPPLPCAIARWRPGTIDLSCTTDVAGYAAVSSTAAPGWTAVVDGAERPWLTADVLRRAVRIEAGTHHISWSYAVPGLRTGCVLAAVAILGLLALWLAHRR